MHSRRVKREPSVGFLICVVVRVRVYLVKREPSLGLLMRSSSFCLSIRYTFAPTHPSSVVA